MKRTFSLLLVLCLLLASMPMAQAGDCPKGGTHEITADGTYTVVTTEATCTEAGMAIYTCTECGEVFAEEETEPATGHDQRGTLSAMPATCTEPETEYVECSKCGEMQAFGTSGEALGHHYVETARTDATCTTDGSVTYTCDREGCGASYTETLAAEGHDQRGTLSAMPATCTEPETEYVECSKCGEMQVFGTSGEALGHNYMETARTPATCTEKGSVTYTCDREGCGDSYTEELPPAEHNYVARVIPATCKEPEIHVNECTECLGWVNLQYIGEVLPHEYVEYDRIEPTCTDEGTSFLMCQGCESTKEETLPALGHDYKETSRKNATCTEKGSVTYTCTRCGDTYTESLKAKGHDWTTSDGITYTCTRCGLTEVDGEAKAEVEATPMPDAVGDVNENGDLTDLTLTSAIKQVGGGYSLRREEATLNSITLASEKDPENAWMRLTASEPAKQLGMLASFIGDKITLTLTENDEELKITSASLDGHVLTITTSSGAVFELSTLNVSLGYTEPGSISEKNLDRIIFSRSGSVLMIDFGSAEAMKAEEAAALTVPDDTSLPTAEPSPTPAPTSASQITITWSRRTITTATPTPDVVVINTPDPVEIQKEEETVVEIQEDSPIIIIYPCESEETVEEYQRSNCPHKWVYEEENNCQSPRTCEICGLYEETPSSHCWYLEKKDVNSGYWLLGCLYCNARMTESSLNQAQGFCTHPRLDEEKSRWHEGNDSSEAGYYWCDTAIACPDCNRVISAVGHNWKITGQDGDYYNAECTRCGKTVSAHKKFYNDATGKLNMSDVSCTDDPTAHQWTVIEADGCKRTLVCANCGKQVEMDHDWKSTKDGCHYTAVCSVCGKTETATIHDCIGYEADYTGKHVYFIGWQMEIKLTCSGCDEIIDCTKFYVGVHNLDAVLGSDKFIGKLTQLTDGQDLPIYPSNVPFYFSEEYIRGE